MEWVHRMALRHEHLARHRDQLSADERRELNALWTQLDHIVEHVPVSRSPYASRG